MASTLDTFKLMFPELCGDDTASELWLAQADAYLCEDSWGDCYESACLYLAAHEMFQSKERQAAMSAGGVPGSAGVVNSASADGLSVGFAVPDFAVNGSISETQYAKTPYGLKYLQLRDACIGNGRLAGTVQETAAEQVFP